MRVIRMFHTFSSGIIEWILITGEWNDNYFWMDEQTWID